MRRLGLGLVLAAMLVPAVGLAQNDETLADIRQELGVLSGALDKLKHELSTTGAAGDPALGQTLIDRADALEAEMQRLTAKTEALQLQINRVVSDGTNRIGDIEFRVCELEPKCDPANMPETKPLGGDAPAAAPAAPKKQSGAGPQLAVAEQSDFDRAKEAFDSGDYVAATSRFAEFQQSYPGSPMAGQVGLMYGQALHEQGDIAGAARVWLETFSAKPDGPDAPEAVLRLGRALGQLGKVEEACVTLSEIGARYAGTPQVAQAKTEKKALSCK